MFSQAPCQFPVNTFLIKSIMFLKMPITLSKIGCIASNAALKAPPNTSATIDNAVCKGGNIKFIISLNKDIIGGNTVLINSSNGCINVINKSIIGCNRLINGCSKLKIGCNNCIKIGKIVCTICIIGGNIICNN